MTFTTGTIVSQGNKTGIIIDRAMIRNCWDVKWSDETITTEHERHIMKDFSGSIRSVGVPSTVVLSSVRENLTWKKAGDDFSKFIKNPS